MNQNDFLAALRRDGAAFAAALDGVPFDAEVSSCPGWAVADLWWHLTEVHDFWRAVVADRLGNWKDYTQPPRPPDAELPAMYAGGLERIAATLGAEDPATPVWTWSKDNTAGFVQRRMAQETAVHRWDAEHAVGRDASIEPELASDGVDEFLVHFAPEARQGAQPVGGTVHLHCTDVAGEWLVVPSAGGEGEPPFTVTREHAKGDCALRGAASDLLLALWRRVPLSTVDVVGDAAVAQRFIAHTSTE